VSAALYLDTAFLPLSALQMSFNYPNMLSEMPEVRVNGINIYYRVQGKGEPLVLIMGLGGECGDWLLQARTFKKYYRVVTFDNRGVGRSDKPAESYTVKTMADDTVGLMYYLGIEKAHILGVSMGGMIAQEVAINYPERVWKLILVSTNAGREEKGGHSPELLKAMGLREGFSDEDVRSVDIGRVTSSLNAHAFNSGAVKIVAVPFCWVRGKLFGIEGMKGQFEAAMAHSTLDRLHMIKAPTLVIAGTQDRIIPPGSADVLASRIPGARLVKIEGGSHTLVAEKRSRFNREVLDFLAH
jgi:pimeloyl-ACP methyl ester carboxylesterase